MTIRGKWKISEAILGGKKLASHDFEKLRLDLDENSYQLIENVVIDSGIIELIPDKSPKALSITGVYGPNKGKTFQCIYCFDGEDLVMCYNLGGDGIPAEFETKDKSMLYLVRYNRIS